MSARRVSVGLAPVAAAFGLGEPISQRRVAEGLMNPNWELTTSTGRYAVKQLRDATPSAVRKQHLLLPRLAARGLPVPQPCTSPAGETVLQVGAEWYAVTPWLAGDHRLGATLGLDLCASLGELTGRLHAALADLLPPPDENVLGPPRTVAETADDYAKYAEIAARGTSDFDRYLGPEIATRRALLHRVAAERPPDREVPPTGWTHGDLHGLNLLYTGDTVTAILDWDRIGSRPLAYEVIRGGTIMFETFDPPGIDLARLGAFVRGYRSRIALSDATLEDGARRRWWSLICSTWPLHKHYSANDSGCDHLFVSIGGLARWWTDHFDELLDAVTGSSNPVGDHAAG